jgi:hypothetical protein
VPPTAARPTTQPPAEKAPPLPPAPTPAPPSPSPRPSTTQSTTSQPNETKNPAPDSKALDNTLERLRALQAQRQPPKSVYNPPHGGAPGGGSPTGVDNAKLSAAAARAVGDRLRECWTTNNRGAKDFDQQAARLMVTTDASGTIRDAQIVEGATSPVGRAFAEQARRAALDAQCATLPLPPNMLGSNHTFEITFRP